MPRSLRITTPGFHHVYNRANNRRSINLIHETYEYFIFLLNYIREKHHIQIYSYCLMTNHYHIFLKTNSENISIAMQEFASMYSSYINGYTNGIGPVFASRYRSKYVKDMHYFHQVIRYIHLNPVEAGIVNHPSEYRWSSFNEFLTKTQKPLVERKDVIQNFISVDDFCHFHEMGNSITLVKKYTSQRSSNIL